MSRLGRGPTPRWPQGVGIGLLPHTQVLLPLPERSAAPGLRAAGVWGGAACPRGGPGQRERDSETAGGQCGGTGTASRWAGGVLGTPVSQKSPRAGAQPDMQRVQGGLRDPPPCLGVTLGTGSGGRGREGGSGRAEPRAAGCGERERGDKPCSMRRPPSRQAETETPPLSAQLWGPALAGTGTNPSEWPVVPSGRARLPRVPRSGIPHVGCSAELAPQDRNELSTPCPQHPHPHLAAMHDLHLRGLTPLWGPGTRGGTLAAARAGLWL